METDDVFYCECGAQCRDDQTEECHVCGSRICHSCTDQQDGRCVNCYDAPVEFEACSICGGTEANFDGFCPHCEIAMEVKPSPVDTPDDET